MWRWDKNEGTVVEVKVKVTADLMANVNVKLVVESEVKRKKRMR
jgi:hypothetical protein